MKKVAKWCKSEAQPYCSVKAISNLPNWKENRSELEKRGLVRKHGGRKDTIEITKLGWDYLNEKHPEITRRRRGETFEL